MTHTYILIHPSNIHIPIHLHPSNPPSLMPHFLLLQCRMLAQSLMSFAPAHRQPATQPAKPAANQTSHRPLPKSAPTHVTLLGGAGQRDAEGASLWQEVHLPIEVLVNLCTQYTKCTHSKHTVHIPYIHLTHCANSTHTVHTTDTLYSQYTHCTHTIHTANAMYSQYTYCTHTICTADTLYSQYTHHTQSRYTVLTVHTVHIP